MSEDARGRHLNMSETPDSVPSITCPKCQRKSANPNDIREKYCGHCHQFHEFMDIDKEAP